MPREWRFRIQDILTALAKIDQYTTGLDYQSFVTNDQAVDAVLFNLQIIGEAARFIPDSVTARWPVVPWARMRGLRNFIVHQYFSVDHEEIWSTVVPDLPPLASQLKAVLASEDDAG